MGNVCIDPYYSNIFRSGQSNFSKCPSNLNPTQLDADKIDLRPGLRLSHQEIARAESDFKFKRRRTAENVVPFKRAFKLFPR